MLKYEILAIIGRSKEIIGSSKIWQIIAQKYPKTIKNRLKYCRINEDSIILDPTLTLKNMAKGCQNKKACKKLSCFILFNLFQVWVDFGPAKIQQFYLA